MNKQEYFEDRTEEEIVAEFGEGITQLYYMEADGEESCMEVAEQEGCEGTFYGSYLGVEYNNGEYCTFFGLVRAVDKLTKWQMLEYLMSEFE